MTAADDIIARLRGSTGLKTNPWAEIDGQLLQGIDARARTGTIIGAFSPIAMPAPGLSR